MGISFSINPLDFLKIFMEERRATKAEAVAWLEDVRKEVRALSGIWLQVAEVLETSDAMEMKASWPKLTSLFGPQYAIGSRLQEFYKLSGSVIGNSVHEGLQREFAQRMGTALTQRSVTRQMALNLVKDIKREQIILLDESNHTASIQSIKDMATVLQRELAALEVFITKIKSTPRWYSWFR